MNIEELLNTQKIWQASRSALLKQASITSGWPDLDALLPSEGWPLGTLIEVQCPAWGIGELRLFLPLMRAMQQKQVVWLSPPYQPFGPALLANDIDVQQHHCIESDDKDFVWTCDQLLRQQACGLVLAWPSRRKKDLRRLQLAANQGQSIAILFYQEPPQHSFAAIRLRLNAAEQGLELQFRKLRGAHAGQSVYIALPDETFL